MFKAVVVSCKVTVNVTNSQSLKVSKSQSPVHTSSHFPVKTEQAQKGRWCGGYDETL